MPEVLSPVTVTTPRAPRELDLETTGELLAALQRLAGADELDAGLDHVAGVIDRLLPSQSMGILLLDAMGHDLRFAAHRGLALEVASHWRFGLGQGIVGTVAKTGQAILAADVHHDPAYIQTTESVRSELAVPIRARGRAIGVLNFERASAGGFSAKDQELAQFLADHLGPAIEQAQVHQAGRQQTRTLSLLHEVARELGSILDRRDLLSRVGERLKALIDFDYFSVLFWNEATGRLEPWVAVDREGPAERTFMPCDQTGILAKGIPLGVGLCGTAAALRQAVRVPNVFLDPRYVRCQSDLEVHSELVVPLLFEGRLLGVVDLESSEYDAFRSEHEHLLTTLAASLAIALENARLYECRRAEEERLTADLETARQIQLQLLPKSTPWVPGLQLGVAYEAARQLGGDFYDFLPAGSGADDPATISVAVGDVAGKSTGAALYGSFAIGMLRELHQHHAAAPGGVLPSALLADLNSTLHGLGFLNRFVALTLATYAPASRRLRIANGGLPHPLHLQRQADGGYEVRNLEVGGVPLGLLADRRYDTIEVVLAPGDLVIIASDGIEEALDRHGVELGGQRMAEALARLAGAPTPGTAGAAEPSARSARDLAQGLLDVVHRHALGTESSDDRTIVVLRVT